MTSVRMKKLSSGPDGTRHPGKVYQVSAEEGRALVECEAAAWVVEPIADPIVESAVRGAPETAVGAGQRARGKPRPPSVE